MGKASAVPLKTILVVDDDALNRELLEEMLRQHEFRVESAFNGQHSLQEFTRIRPDLILLDVQMPLLDGFAVCRQLKSNPETRLTPIILVTALSAVEDRVRGLEA